MRLKLCYRPLLLVFVLATTGCAVDVKQDSETVKSPVVNTVRLPPAESQLTEAVVERGNASQCAKVDETAARGACFKPAKGNRMCQPQSIPYARCRSRITSCNLGNTSPVQLFNCEHQRGYTSSVPKAGSLMSIGVNRIHHMSTGHTLYVEEVCRESSEHFKLRVSHTNYDRQCHLEEDAWVDYDSKRKTADFESGHWAAWGKDLPVQGFILPESAVDKSGNQ